ncbi:hypothetical protein [Bartonella sp. CB169]|uniref:hypothetical protein n=1 Tax=Bartonella sp. CB169 TaxID=3112257 RepID=UPI00300E1F4E
MMDYNKQPHTSQNYRAEHTALPEESPVDPAVERVRKKLMLFMITTLSITFILVLVVLFLAVYKTIAMKSAPKQIDPFSSSKQNSEIAYYTLSLPEKTQILSQSLSGHNILLKILTPDGTTQFMVYNYHTGTLIAVLSVETTKGKPAPNLIKKSVAAPKST